MKHMNTTLGEKVSCAAKQGKQERGLWLKKKSCNISPYKYLLVASPASPICTMKPRYQYIVGNLYSQGRFAEKQNFDFRFLPPERSQSVVVKMKL